MDTLLESISSALQGGVGAKIVRCLERHQAALPTMLQQQLQQQQQQQQQLPSLQPVGAPTAMAATGQGLVAGAVSGGGGESTLL